MIKFIYKIYKSWLDPDDAVMLQGEHGYFEIIVGEHSYGDIPKLKDLELSSSLLDLWFKNIAEALILLMEIPEVYIGDVDNPLSWLQFQVKDKNDIFVNLLVLENKQYGELVQRTLNTGFEKKWGERIKKRRTVYCI